MKSFLRIWILLTAAHLFARFAVSFLGFRHLDLREQVVFQALLLPTLQSLALVWYLGRLPGRDSVWALGRTLIRQPVILFFSVLDGTVLAFGLVLEPRHAASLLHDGGIPTYYSAAKGWAASLLLIALSRRSGWAALDRTALSLLAVGLGLYTLDYHMKWLQALPALFAPQWPLLFRQALANGTLFLLLLALVLQVYQALNKHCRESATVVGLAAFALIAGAMAVVLKTYSLPYLVATQSTFVKMCSFLFLSLVWIGILTAWEHRAISIGSKKNAEVEELC